MGVTVYCRLAEGQCQHVGFQRAALREAVDKACSLHVIRRPMIFRPGGRGLLATVICPTSSFIIRGKLRRSRHRNGDRCEESARSFDKRISNSEGASVSTNAGARAYGNSHGFLQSIAKTSHSLSCTVIGEADGDMQRDYWYSAARDATTAGVNGRLGRSGAAGPSSAWVPKIETTTAPVVFAPEMARGFIGHAICRDCGRRAVSSVVVPARRSR